MPAASLVPARLARLAAALGVALAFAAPALAQQQVGTVTGLPLPRYASLKSDRVNLREGPSKEHRTRWIFQRAGLPVEIVAEFETWRRIRDSEGAEGWVLHSLLSGRRTALVAPWKKDATIEIHVRPEAGAPVAARLQTNVIGNVRKCDGQWCRMSGEGFDGFIPQASLWGAYPGEKID
ncbi:MAG: hypothetical protein JNK46_03885 [Methylobacteriaceae bacterium]|nr:hypothetical protein [Methylobacteriaceae bacterium]